MMNLFNFLQETQGVTVVTFQAPEKDFPAFYSIKSGSKAPYNVNNAFQAANLIATSEKLCLRSGILIAVPIPKEFAMDGNNISSSEFISNFPCRYHFNNLRRTFLDQEINLAISEALADAKRSGIAGKDATPFLLSAIAKITAGKSLGASMNVLSFKFY